MEDKDNYYEDLEIDEYNLLEEWQHQAGLFMSYASDSTKVQQEVDDLKDAIDVAEAKVELEIRNGEYSLMPEDMKVTEKAVASLVTTNPDIIKLKKKYNEAKKEATLYKKIEQSFEMRKKALENMVILTGREQYAEPRDRSDYVESQKKDKITEKLNKTKKD
jgi:hypothetical protein